MEYLEKKFDDLEARAVFNLTLESRINQNRVNDFISYLKQKFGLDDDWNLNPDFSSFSHIVTGSTWNLTHAQTEHLKNRVIDSNIANTKLNDFIMYLRMEKGVSEEWAVKPDGTGFVKYVLKEEPEEPTPPSEEKPKATKPKTKGAATSAKNSKGKSTS